MFSHRKGHICLIPHLPSAPLLVRSNLWMKKTENGRKMFSKGNATTETSGESGGILKSRVTTGDIEKVARVKRGRCEMLPVVDRYYYLRAHSTLSSNCIDNFSIVIYW